MSPRRILVFDSGVGGLSIVAAIRRHLPNATVLSFADREFYPYGLRSDREVMERVLNLAPLLCEREQADLLVLACNTAATLVLEALRQRISLPIVGVVPPIRPAVRLSKSKVIGIMATPGTLKRPYLDDLLQRFAADCEIIAVASPRAVDLAERLVKTGQLDAKALEGEIAPFLACPRLDTVALACTHFSHLKAHLRVLGGERISWVDSAAAIARRVASLLKGAAT